MSLQEIIESFRTGLMLTGLWVLAAIVAGCIGVWLYRSAHSTTALLRRLRTWIDGVVFTLLFTACVLIGGTKTNSPPMGLMVPLPPSLPQSVVQTVTDEDIARGYREVAETNCEASVYAMPEGITPSFNWHKRGTFGEWARLDLGDFAFPLGTNDGAVTSFSVFNDGRIRPTPRDAAREICAVGVPMLAMQGASRFWVGEVATERDPPGLVTTERDPPRIRLTWENFFLNADTNAPVNAQIELVANGDFVTRSNDVERIYRRVEPFDWDGDGLENTVDPDPFVAGPDAHGTNAEWYNVVCSNVLEAVEGDGSAGTPRPTLSWLDGVNTNAYYFVDVVTTNCLAPIYFTGDRESRLGNPVVVARAFETNHVPLLIGINYAVTSPVPFTVSIPDDGFATVMANGVSNCEVHWPLEFSVSPDGNGGFYTSVIPYDPGGTFQWGGSGGGGLRSMPSEPSQCEFSVNGNWLGFMCYGGNCGCEGCSVNGTYTMESATFNLPTLFCGCSTEPSGGDPDPPPLTPSVNIAFSAPALIFEDRYEASPDNWVEKRSTTNVLTVLAYGGEHGGTLMLTAGDLDCLEHHGGPVSLPSQVVLGPYQSYSATFRCKGAENGGTPWAWGIISGPDGSDSSYAQTSVVRVEIQKLQDAPANQCLNRHEYGIGEKMLFRQKPGSPEVDILAEDVKILGVGTRTIEWGVSNIEHTLSFSLNEVRYTPLVTIHKPTGIEGYDAQAMTNGLPIGAAGGIQLVQRYKVLPLTVNFSALEIEEVPCDDAIPPTGYFIYTSPDDYPRTHNADAGAGRLWMSVDAGNCLGAILNVRDRAGCGVALPRRMPDGTETTDPTYGWLGGSMTWKVPFGWRKMYDSSVTEPIGQFAEDTRQVMSITADGEFRVEKLQHTATRMTNGTITVDGHLDDGILDN